MNQPREVDALPKTGSDYERISLNGQVFVWKGFYWSKVVPGAPSRQSRTVESDHDCEGCVL